MKTLYVFRTLTVIFLVFSLMVMNLFMKPALAQSTDYSVVINNYSDNRIDVDFVNITVKAGNAVELLMAGAAEAENSRESNAVQAQLAIELSESFSSQSAAEVKNQALNLEVEINSKLEDLMEVQGGSSSEIAIRQRQVAALNVFKARLRVDYYLYTLNEDSEGNFFFYNPNLYGINGQRLIFVEWGNFSEISPQCLTKARAEFGNDFFDEDGDVKGCEEIRVTYKGKIQVSNGSIEVLNTVLGNNDHVDVTGDNHIEFTSTVGAFRDGLWIKFKPDNATDRPLMTIVMNNISINAKLDELTNKNYSLEDGQKLNIFSQIQPFFINEATLNSFIDGKTQLSSEIDALERFEFRVRSNNDAGNAVILRGIITDLKSYNFYGSDVGNAAAKIDSTLSSVAGIENHSRLQASINELRLDLNNLQSNSRMRKYQAGIIPFRDTDDHMWYSPYVAKIKSLDVVSGYEDISGHLLGEFRPDNLVTVAEGIKIALVVAGKPESSRMPDMLSARRHWAKGYVAEAEENNMSIVSSSLDLNRKATRAELITMMLEALNITVPAADDIFFDDVPANHSKAKFIDYAYDIGVISGDDNTEHFRPNVSINRAEVAKIAYLINYVLLGGK